MPLVSGTQGHLRVQGWLVTTAEFWQQPVCVKGPCGRQCPHPALVVTMSHQGSTYQPQGDDLKSFGHGKEKTPIAEAEKLLVGMVGG